jgi:uncharacterized membrane protein
VYSQIWLNIIVDACQFGYITKLGKKEKEKSNLKTIVWGQLQHMSVK